ncbi:hypothetical protein HD597_004079 [Nonomuraea thailandensis]|uniref:Secreted protein n=1 Tax=Nonomuraea thailandensis TaxID=1188745 RepID=A0A9X2GDD5_9ACTN|nr:hypothetical protein [Nonomuraea thailandensis]MCP2357059.1 hypothetical protein [Nonomuraea thailandensis]
MRKALILAAATTAIGLSLVATAQAGTAVPEDVAGHLSLMSQGQAAADQLPAFVSAGTEVGDLVAPATTRLLGSASGGTYWSGIDAGGRLCLITVIGDTAADFVAGASCAPPSEFTGKGVGLQVAGPPGASEAYLLPDGVPASRLGDGYTVVSPNLVLSDPAAEPAAPRGVAGTNGTFTLSDLAPTPVR